MRLDPTVVVAVIAALGSLMGVIYSNRTAVRSARAAQASAEKTAQSKVDAEAFVRARDNYEAANREQEARITRLRAEMIEDRDEARREADECKRRIDSLQRQVDALREWARPLLRAARAAGIQHPDPPVWLGTGDTDPNLPRSAPG